MHGSVSATSSRGTPSRRGKSPRFSTDSLSQAGSSTLPSNFSNKPSSTFTSSLSIPVEGAVPIVTDSSTISEHAETDSAPTTESKRAPRKSKTDALVALNNQARSSSVGPDNTEPVEDLTEKYRNATPIPVLPTLDLSSVKTPGLREKRKSSSSLRPFGLSDCPEFFPTMEEFKDPMSFIKSIADQAKEYGICKIVPPADWKMPFVTDTENFRFKTRLQRLNSIEASSRAKVNFLEQLYRFHKQQGNSRVVVPTINHKPLDLWLLRKEVQKLGGYDAVTKGKKWSDLGRILGYRGIPGLSTQIKNSYTRVILPFEHFCDRARNSPAMSPIITRDSHLKTHTNIQSASNLSRLSTAVNSRGESSPPGSPLTATSSPLSEVPDEEYKDANGSKPPSTRPRRSTRVGSQERSNSPKKPASSAPPSTPVIPSPIFYDKREEDTKPGSPEQHCEICHKKNHGEEMLLCDGCDCGFHMFCLDPPLDTIPKEQWFCFTCLSGTGGDFGFDEGEEHSLSSFQARDLEFRKMWFESHPPKSNTDGSDLPSHMKNKIGKVTISEYDIEEEFWRLVQSQNETVEIEYGADVHSTTHGSAMPTMETHPLDAYSKDPWNLNNIPILSQSLLRFIKSDISGMTVPWTYVGMAFSTFCWHNEDHYTYSVNYMHWGETKTWYGIPGDDAERFEAAIKCEAPDLFEAQPDLLFQLVTLMNPQRVSEAGVRVYACNQRAGEFVITFPKAYHAGFNHGLNFNEAVNFALPDWLPYGRDCVQRYREHRKLPVFSHDELIITITQQSQSIKTAMWLIDSLKEMTDREMNDRRKARSSGVSETLSEEDRAEDQYQCAICKVFCYLSQVTCQCTMKVVCVDHIGLLCDSRITHHRITLRKRFSDEELLDTLSKVSERAGIPSAWRSKLNRLLLESARPPLRSLRALLAEGDRINYHLPEMASLRKCVTRANEWVDSANSFIIRKQSRKRSRRSRGRPPANEALLLAAEDPGDRPDRGLDELYAHLREVEALGFDCPEIGTLRGLAQQAEDTKIKAATLLNTSPALQEREEFLQDCKRLLLEGSSLNILLDEIQALEKIVDREQLIKELEEKLEDVDTGLTLEEVHQLLARARASSLSPDNKHMKLLEARQREGDNLEQRAKDVLDQQVKTIDELDEFANLDAAIPINPSILDRIISARAKAKDFEKQAVAWLNPGPDASLKPRVHEVVRLCARAEKDYSIAAVQELKRAAEIAMDLENRCEQVLRNRYHRIEEDVFTSIKQWKSYAREHLKIFSLPSFDKLNSQVELHYRWLRELPWFCNDHNEAHGQSIFDDVIEWTRPEDDQPPSDEFFTCICNAPVRPPPPGVISDAVQCDHCYARFHGECAKNGGSCPFCDHHHWNGTIHKERNWHFCFLPPLLKSAPDISKIYSEDFKQLEIVVHRVDRLSATIGHFLSYTSQPQNQRPEFIPQVRHHMRKLYKLQFAVSPNPDVSFGLDLAGLHRILAGRPPTTRPKKRRRPRFTFGQDADQDWQDGTRCICRGRTSYLLNYPTVKCELCSKSYHASCVFYPLKPPQTLEGHMFLCPLCCVRKGKTYQYAEVRVQHMDKGLEPYIFVNTQEMLKLFSKVIIYMKLKPPCSRTVFIELMHFQPGIPDETNGSSSTSRPTTSHTNPQHAHQSVIAPTPVTTTVMQTSTNPGPSYHPHMGLTIHNHVVPPAPPQAQYSNTIAAPPSYQHVPPPPPWSRWGTMSTPSRPPSTQRRAPAGEGSSRRSTPQPSRKRKHVEEGGVTVTPVEGSSSSAKRRTMQQVHPPPPQVQPPQQPISQAPHLPPPPQPQSQSQQQQQAQAQQLQPPHTPPARPIQTLSPSLAMIMSPTNQTVQLSPRSPYIPPIRNGVNGSSPTLPPVKSLVIPGNS